MKFKVKKLLIIIILIITVVSISIIGIDLYINSTGSSFICSEENTSDSDAIIVFGALVFSNGMVSDMLADRLNFGYELYKLKKAPKIVVSGDHGQATYDEVNAMRLYLQSKGVPREDIFMDHAGFDTYNTLYRARDVFEIKKAILVSQEYHLVRALYIGKTLGMEVCGVASDSYVYPGMGYYRAREVGARFKAFIQAGVFKPEPKYLGEAIPIWKSGYLTDDGL